MSEILAKTIWGEARGEPLAGKVAVANVIINRADKGGWWGSTIEDVCLKDQQFSCWNEFDPNFKKLRVINKKDPAFRDCLMIAEMADKNLLNDVTDGATHYHAIGADPWWSRDQTPVATIGNHAFYKGIG